MAPRIGRPSLCVLCTYGMPLWRPNSSTACHPATCICGNTNPHSSFHATGEVLPTTGAGRAQAQNGCCEGQWLEPKWLEPKLRRLEPKWLRALLTKPRCSRTGARACSPASEATWPTRNHNRTTPVSGRQGFPRQSTKWCLGAKTTRCIPQLSLHNTTCCPCLCPAGRQA